MTSRKMEENHELPGAERAPDGAPGLPRRLQADNHFMTFYSEPSQPLLDLLKAHHVGFKWFSFLRGLDPTPAQIHGMDRETRQAV